MVRGKVQLKRVENPIYRQISFCKRRAGLLKKARELAVLCDAEIGVIVFSAHGKLYELATNGNMQSLIARYNCTTSGTPGKGSCETIQPQVAEEHADMLKQQTNLLFKALRYNHGRDGTSDLTFDELEHLEKSLEVWIYHIRSTKMQIFLQQIERLRNQEGILQATSEVLKAKIWEQNWELLEPNMMMPSTGPYPLNFAYNYCF
ncbi:MADS-box transcription factor [Rhynchospora pubera]|uniref:MADS-box transcription factor n=1 Tax=Rhynchospora pubera TaxID=906938 RepID=A0AAV8FAM7_9POAL|nr:MADS-box transcription factor [Rhynchospora pubera]KAJ4790417.1 MADS-box transcription factor [Rhynchospora pubera]